MNEQRLRAALRAPRTECDPSDSSDAVRRTNLARLRPEIDRTAAILQKRQEARRQNLAFLACSCAFALAAFFAYRNWTAGGTAVKGLLLGGVIVMVLILILSPLMAYCLEEEREHEKT